MLPVVVQLWSMSDRAIRTTLLKTLKSLVALTPAAFVNKSVFDPMLAGFADSNAKMREDTLKNLVHVVDKLDEKNMQEKLTRCISNLQNDAECSIRTNATIFLGRIAARLKDGVRARVICPAFAKAMRDPFVHCRLAGLKAAVACIELLDVPQLTGKIMPQACTLLVDRSADVREMSLNLLDASTAILRRHHEKTVQSDKAAAAVAAAAGAGAGAGGSNGHSGSDAGDRSGSSASWTSWVSDGLSKTIEKATDSAPEARQPGPAAAPNSTSSSTSSSSSSTRVAAALGGVATSSRTSSNVSMDNESSFIGQLPAGEADGWGDDDWGDEAASEEGNGWGDEDLDLDEDAEEPPASPAKGPVGTLGTLGAGTDAGLRSSGGPASTSSTNKPLGGLGKSGTSTVIAAVASSSAKSSKVKAVVTKINKDAGGDKWDDDW